MSVYFTPPATVLNGATSQASDVNDLNTATTAGFDAVESAGNTVPPIVGGDAYKVLQVNVGETARENVTSLRITIDAADGTEVLDNGTDGTDATFTGDVTGDVTGNADTATDADTLDGEHGAYYQQALNDIRVIDLDASGSGNRSTYINFNSDDTYTDYGLRIIRNDTGPNATSEIKHRGTGNIGIFANEASATSFKYQNNTIWTAGNDGTGSGLDADTVDGAHFLEGTWTPELWDDSLSGSESQTYSFRYGNYTKLGDRVFFDIYLQMSSLGTLTGAQGAKISLPFLSKNTAGQVSAVHIGNYSSFALSTTNLTPIGFVQQNAQYVTLHVGDNSSSPNSAVPLDLNDFSADGTILLSGSYVAA